MICSRKISLGRRGVAALEYAFVAPLFFLLIFGITEVSRLGWTQITLDRAVNVASRCAALRNPSCATTADTSNFASQSAPALTVASSVFTASYPGCGAKVEANYPFRFIVPVGSYSTMTLTASACTPIINSSAP